MAWAKNGTPDTLGSAGDTLTISNLTEQKFYSILSHAIDNGTNGLNMFYRIDNDSGSVYAQRDSIDGGADTARTSRSSLNDDATSGSQDRLSIMYCSNISGEEALFINFVVYGNTAGAGTAPKRAEIVGKDSGTTQFTRIDYINAHSGDMAIDSNLSAIGSD